MIAGSPSTQSIGCSVSREAALVCPSIGPSNGEKRNTLSGCPRKSTSRKIRAAAQISSLQGNSTVSYSEFPKGKGLPTEERTTLPLFLRGKLPRLHRVVPESMPYAQRQTELLIDNEAKEDGNSTEGDEEAQPHSTAVDIQRTTISRAAPTPGGESSTQAQPDVDKICDEPNAPSCGIFVSLLTQGTGRSSSVG